MSPQMTETFLEHAWQAARKLRSPLRQRSGSSESGSRGSSTSSFSLGVGRAASPWATPTTPPARRGRRWARAGQGGMVAMIATQRHLRLHNRGQQQERPSPPFLPASLGGCAPGGDPASHGARAGEPREQDGAEHEGPLHRRRGREQEQFGGGERAAAEQDIAPPEPHTSAPEPHTCNDELNGVGHCPPAGMPAVHGC